MLVTAVGVASEWGLIMDKVTVEEQEETPLQQKLGMRLSCAGIDSVTPATKATHAKQSPVCLRLCKHHVFAAAHCSLCALPVQQMSVSKLVSCADTVESSCSFE